MCGFLGLMNHQGIMNQEQIWELLRLIQHRGPDSHSVFCVGDGDGVFAFARLSIIDLEGGTQPIYNEDRSIAVILNGEIYNYQELTERLKANGHQFYTNSDTEVLVHLYEEDGIGMLSRLRGMFAFALWEEKTGRLYLVRDRLGIKPLYYAVKDKMIGFASEIKPMLRLPFVSKTLSEKALRDFLNYGYVVAPDTMFQDIYKLEPGHYLIIESEKIINKEYWDCSERHYITDTTEKIEQKVRELLEESVRLHMRSDVPVGVFLSGGIDSGLIAAMAAKTTEQIETYTIRFEDAAFDESEMAVKVAEKYRTKHHCYTVSSDRIKELFPKMMWAFDEPLGDSGILPNYIINELAVNDGIKVVLTGAGGDELFAGYSYYLENAREQRLRKYIWPVKKIAYGLNGIYPEVSRKLIRSVSYETDRYLHYIGHKTIWGDGVLKRLLSISVEEPSYTTRRIYDRCNGDELNRCLYTDIKTYLCDDLLCLADRASMIHSVEGRVPFLDHKLVEYAMDIPDSVKLLQGSRKGLLKKVAEQFLPKELIDLPKQGFNAPINTWSNGEFGNLMINVLKSERCQSRFYWNSKELNRYLKKKTVLGKDFHKTYLLFTLEMYMRIHIDNDFKSPKDILWRKIYET